MEKAIRLDKFLADMGKGSRSQIREAAKKGRVLVNGEPEKRTDRKITPGTDKILLDGIPVQYRKYEYYMLNKPRGVVSATEDNHCPTVVDLLGKGPEGDLRRDLFPVGRLDKDTEGLLILTNDGELAHRLLSPRCHVDKVYYAQVTGRLPADAAAVMAEGMTLKDGTQVLPARLEIVGDRPVLPAGREPVDKRQALSGKETILGRNRPPIEQKPPGNAESGVTEVLLTIQEGKFHQVKRMFEALDCQVVYLKRLSMGPVRLDASLKPGEYRRLTEEEIGLLGGGT